MSCNHALGVRDGGWLCQSDLEEEGRRLRAEFEDWAKQPNAPKVLVESRRGYTDQQFVEEHYSMFNYCPDCGRWLR